MYVQSRGPSLRREATVKYFKLCRAQEEIVGLNIEMRRLRTAIHDEKLRTEASILSLTETQPFLAAELRHRWNLRAAVNNAHIQGLDGIEHTAGFTRFHGIGIRKGPAGPLQNGMMDIEEQSPLDNRTTVRNGLSSHVCLPLPNKALSLTNHHVDKGHC